MSSKYEKGDRVRVTSGALRDVPGVVVRQSPITSLLTVTVQGADGSAQIDIHVMPYEVKREVEK